MYRLLGYSALDFGNVSDDGREGVLPPEGSGLFLGRVIYHDADGVDLLNVRAPFATSGTGRIERLTRSLGRCEFRDHDLFSVRFRRGRVFGSGSPLLGRSVPSDFGVAGSQQCCNQGSQTKDDEPERQPGRALYALPLSVEQSDSFLGTRIAAGTGLERLRGGRELREPAR
jgi:hypothetical protein